MDSKILHKGKYLQFCVNEAGWEYFHRHNCRGIVIVLALTGENKLLFVEQHRPPVKKRVIEFPAGLINDAGGSAEESVDEAAKRELLEETGYRAQSIREILTGPVSAGATCDLVTIVRADGLTKVHEGGGDKTEDITVHEIEVDGAEDWLEAKAGEGFLIEPKIYSGLYFIQKEKDATA